MVLGHSTVEPACEDLDFWAFFVFSFSSIEVLSVCPFVQPIKRFCFFLILNWHIVSVFGSKMKKMTQLGFWAVLFANNVNLPLYYWPQVPNWVNIKRTSRSVHEDFKALSLMSLHTGNWFTASPSMESREVNDLVLNLGKTKELILDFWRKAPPMSSLSTTGTDVERSDS